MTVEESYSLKELNTFGIDAKAKYYSSFSSTDELIFLLQKAVELQSSPFILGGGSNMLLSQDLDQFVLKNNIRGIEVVSEDDETVTVKAGGGEIWHEFVIHCIDQQWGGLENLSLIPGSVGASPIQNIGAYGVEMKDCFVQLEALNKSTLQLETFSKEQCHFGYRDSIFRNTHKGKYIITSVLFKLHKQAKVNTSYGAIQQELTTLGITNPTIKDVSDAVIRIRQSKLPDPKEIGNSGSFFKNPIVGIDVLKRLQEKHPEIPSYIINETEVKLAAGWLIEKAGWKGKRIGDTGMHAKQALVLVNYGNATGKQLIETSQQVQHDVYQMFHIQLEAEVNIL